MDINIYEYSYEFALKVIDTYSKLKLKNEFVLSKQLLRSGTSIGANLREAKGAQSKKDFLNKMNIALKEVYESEYWLELLRDAQYLTNDELKGLLVNCDIMKKILSSIVKTTKTNLQK